MTVLESFADWTSAQPNNWSDTAIERACHAIADTVGSMIAGGREKVVQEVVAGLYRSSEGRAKNVGNDQTSEPSIAACINASAAHLLELDDNYYPALTHASAVSVPALLALAQQYEANGSAVIDAYIIGLELQAAIARGVNRSHYLAGWHGTGTIACIGTAGACARIMGLNRAGIINAMSIATSMAAGNKAQFGTTTKTLQCGLASRNAIAAAVTRVQQMQPFDISTSVSSVRERFAPPSRTRSASMLTSLMSLTITATFLPSLFERTWFNKVVLPAPRKPDSTETGRRLSTVASSLAADMRISK